MIQKNTAHVLYLDLNNLRLGTPRCVNSLTEEERAHYGSYIFDMHKKRFAKRRYILKKVLARYLESRAEQIHLSYHPAGKPYLCNKVHESDIAFNLSHSGDHVVIAITRDNPIGVDVERINRIAEINAIAKMVMSEPEYQQFMLADTPRKNRFFYRIWSRKESLVKAMGVGLSYPIEKINFPDLTPGKHIVTVDMDHQTGRWHVYDIDLSDGLSCAITTKNNIDQIEVKTLSSLDITL